MSKINDWLSLTKEVIMEPDLPICDAHHHLRRPQGNSYLTSDFLADIGNGHNIVKTVCIQSYVNLQKRPGGNMTPVEETEFTVDDIAGNNSRTDIAAAIVGYANLTLGKAVAPLLEAHIAAARGRFRGIRYMVGQPPGLKDSPRYDSLLSNDDFHIGFAALQKYGLTYDVMVPPEQLPDIARLAGKYSGTPIIVNHLGFVDIQGKNHQERREIMQQWKTGITALANHPHVYVKLGGLGMEMFDFGWNRQSVPPGSHELATEMSPYFLYCIEQLGVNRCMFESNFPVDKESYSYNVMWNSFKRVTQGFSATERRALFYGTAAAVYKLGN